VRRPHSGVTITGGGIAMLSRRVFLASIALSALAGRPEEDA
jgi:hypothetical protein